MNKGLLADVVIIRPILIVLLVFYHAFAPYSGAWASIEGYPDVPAYWWLDKLSFAFMLEMFVFVSGYVFGYQVRNKGEGKLNAKNLFWGKFKRLIIPSMVFSLLYIILFRDITQPVSKTIYDILNGVGHMWFLPMLFWCFVGVWALEKIHINRFVALIALLICSLIPFGGLPLQLSKTMYYIVFFYVGYALQRNDVKIKNLDSTIAMVVLSIAFVVLFPVLTMVKENTDSIIIGSNNQAVMSIISGVVKRLCKLIYSSVGILMLLSVVRNVLRKQINPLPEWIIRVGGLCMGVYLLQQFILKGLYNYTELPSYLGPYWLPWVGFIVTLFSSVLLSYAINKTKTGHLLIG